MTKLVMTALSVFALLVAGCASSGSRDEGQSRTAGQFVDDASITSRVKSEIAKDVGTKTASEVNVTTYRGQVGLSGFVDTKDEAIRAEQAARKVKGVQVVYNDLHIKSAAAGESRSEGRGK